MLERAILFCRNEKDKVKYEVIREICSLFGKKFSENLTTVELAALRNEIIERITKNKDPLREIKDESFRVAEKLYGKVERYIKRIKDERERFRKALMVALAGNIIEFGARDHKVNLKNLEEEIFSIIEKKPYVDDIDKVYDKFKKARKILYITDNVAELIFDKIFINEMRKYKGKRIFIAPLSRTVQDDAWVGDVKKAKIEGVEIVPRGNYIGVWLEKCTKEFLERWDESDLIIAKGMGCYETLTEYPHEKTQGKVAMLFKVKCVPVSKHSNVPLGGSVVKII